MYNSRILLTRKERKKLNLLMELRDTVPNIWREDETTSGQNILISIVGGGGERKECKNQSPDQLRTRKKRKKKKKRNPPKKRFIKEGNECKLA